MFYLRVSDMVYIYVRVARAASPLGHVDGQHRPRAVRRARRCWCLPTDRAWPAPDVDVVFVLFLYDFCTASVRLLHGFCVASARFLCDFCTTAVRLLYDFCSFLHGFCAASARFCAASAAYSPWPLWRSVHGSRAAARSRSRRSRAKCVEGAHALRGLSLLLGSKRKPKPADEDGEASAHTPDLTDHRIIYLR